MREREADDTPNPGGPPQPRSDEPAGGYYYDDATGYEPYDPDEDDCSDADEAAGAESGGGGGEGPTAGRHPRG